MSIFRSSRNTSSDGAWTASTRKAPWWSAGAGTYRAHVNSDQLGDYPTRRAAMRAARAEASRRSGK